MENGEWRISLMSDWVSVIGAIRSLREKRMENEAVAQQFSILHSPFTRTESPNCRER